MTEPITVSTTELRKNLAKYLQEACEGRTVYVLSHGYRIAALIPPNIAIDIELRKR